MNSEYLYRLSISIDSNKKDRPEVKIYQMLIKDKKAKYIEVKSIISTLRVKYEDLNKLALKGTNVDNQSAYFDYCVWVEDCNDEVIMKCVDEAMLEVKENISNYIKNLNQLLENSSKEYKIDFKNIRED